MVITTDGIKEAVCAEKDHPLPDEGHGHCGRCHKQRPLSDFPNIGKKAPNRLGNCVHCGRKDKTNGKRKTKWSKKQGNAQESTKTKMQRSAAPRTRTATARAAAALVTTRQTRSATAAAIAAVAAAVSAEQAPAVAQESAVAAPEGSVSQQMPLATSPAFSDEANAMIRNFPPGMDEDDQIEAVTGHRYTTDEKNSFTDRYGRLWKQFAVPAADLGIYTALG